MIFLCVCVVVERCNVAYNTRIALLLASLVQEKSFSQNKTGRSTERNGFKAAKNDKCLSTLFLATVVMEVNFFKLQENTMYRRLENLKKESTTCNIQCW